LTVRTSVVAATYDLLAFAGGGDFGKFDQCFTKACAFFSLSLADLARRKLRSIAFRHLRDGGYLDVSYAQHGTRWSVAPATFVQRCKGDFVLIANSATVAAVCTLAPASSVRWIRSSDGTLSPGAPFFPDVLQLNASDQETEALGRSADVSTSLSYQAQIFRSLPSLRSVLANGVSRDEAGPMFEPNTTARLELSSGEWRPYPEPCALESGLYRTTFDHGAPRFTIAANGNSRDLLTFRVIESEWALVAALALLKAPLRLSYNRSEQRLSVPSTLRRALRLPTLLERSFRSGTLLNPVNAAAMQVYDRITYASMRRLAQKLPLFSIEVSR
jgi:hypothetical protein